MEPLFTTPMVSTPIVALRETVTMANRTALVDTPRSDMTFLLASRLPR
jgi:hypothetical protein